MNLRKREVISFDIPKGTIILDIERSFVYKLENILADAVKAALRGDHDVFGEQWLIAEDILTSSPRAVVRQQFEPRVTDVSLDLSGDCNCACVYCFEKDIDSRKGSMSEETLNECLNYVFTFPSKQLVFHFGSGEPLMNYPTLRKLTDHALEKGAQTGKSINFHLTTNGTLITEEIADFLSKHNFSVRLSIDGPDENHNRMRPLRSGKPSYTSTINGLKLLLEHMPGQTTINTVLTEGNRLISVWEWASTLGVENLQCIRVGTPSGSSLQYNQQIEEFGLDLVQIGESMVTNFRTGASNLRYLPLIKTLRRLMIPEPIVHYCGACFSYIGISTTGDFYPCFRFIGIDEYKIGSYRKGIDLLKKNQIRQNNIQEVDNRLLCKDCWSRYLCGGACYADAEVYGGGIVLENQCRFIRKEIEIAVKLFRDLVDNNPDILLSFFGDENIIDEGHTLPPLFLQRKNCI